FTGDGGPAAAASINGARAVDVDRGGNLYVCEREGNRIRRIDARAGTIRTIAGTGAAGYPGDGGPAAEATSRRPKWVHVDPGAVAPPFVAAAAVGLPGPSSGVMPRFRSQRPSP